jgi:adenylate cyclase
LPPQGRAELELRPKTFEVLRYLVEHAGRLVSKDEIIKTVWPKVMVSDESLIQCVSEVRQAIEDGKQTIIKTVPRRGYMFAAPVLWVGLNSQAPSRQALAQLDRSPDLDEATLPVTRGGPSIAVLPFSNLSGDPQQDYFSDGFTDDIITELSRFSELLVIARNSTFRYKGRATDIRQIGRELNARYILEGSVRRNADRVRINAQLIDAANGSHRCAERYDCSMSDAFAVQDEVARSIVSVLAAHVNKAETERALLKPPARWEAYDCYLRGLETYSMHLREVTMPEIYAARQLFERSLAIDPKYARAYAMISRTHVRTYLEPLDSAYLSPAELARAYELATKAVQLDANLPLARSQLGWVLVFKHCHDESIAEFERALSLNPNFTDYQFGLSLVFAGQPARAIKVLQAHLLLDPFENAGRLGYMGHAYYMCGRYAEAIAPLQECALRIPNLRIAHLWLAAAFAQSNQLVDARHQADEVLRIEPGFSIERWKCTAPYKDPKDADHLFVGLRTAGLPES